MGLDEDLVAEERHVGGRSAGDRPTNDRFQDTRSGSCRRSATRGDASGKLARRPELDRALDFARAGDTLTITKLDRARAQRHEPVDVGGVPPTGVEHGARPDHLPDAERAAQRAVLGQEVSPSGVPRVWGVEPSTAIRPVVGASRPVAIFSSVVFPAPFGPTSAANRGGQAAATGANPAARHADAGQRRGAARATSGGQAPP